MATIQEAAAEVANDLVGRRGGYETAPDLLSHDIEIATDAAILMSQRLGKSIDIDDFLEKTIEFQTRATAVGQGHIQVIVLAGYVAFFTLWSAMAYSVPVWAILGAGAFMVLSLVIFVGWTVVGLFFTKSAMERTLAAYQAGPVDFYPRHQAAEIENLTGRSRLMAWWRPVVYSAGGAAMFAAVILAVASITTLVNKISATANSAPSAASVGPRVRIHQPAP